MALLSPKCDELTTATLAARVHRIGAPIYTRPRDGFRCGASGPETSVFNPILYGLFAIELRLSLCSGCEEGAPKSWPCRRPTARDDAPTVDRVAATERHRIFICGKASESVVGEAG
ncbi:hypothetical protein RW1_014_01860 [Rhodococcus wratislaviensis NBRC 100605]|uniref:Uncharacterized protein n=1 Tax=Rhodococcus wratislaviensis NBRC 100605 TaxID=1219028 RepID=X0PPS9_RHOWR|nr:hypothetical protein RW1_014_01860 [Rhodococcus wratislaviensis NBRC 100605]